MTKHSDSTADSGKVLVPPAGVHTPGDTLMRDTVGRVAVPTDAEADKDAARDAYEKAAAGDLVEVELTDTANAEQASGSPESDAERSAGTGTASGTGAAGKGTTATR